MNERFTNISLYRFSNKDSGLPFIQQVINMIIYVTLLPVIESTVIFPDWEIEEGTMNEVLVCLHFVDKKGADSLKDTIFKRIPNYILFCTDRIQVDRDFFEVIPPILDSIIG